MSINNDMLAEINRYCRSDSLLIIDSRGKLRRLSCPFKVMVIQDIHVFKASDTLDVVAVKISSDLVLLYVIRKIAYPYNLFRIIDQ